MLSVRLLFLFIHVTAVIVALGGSLFSTFALTPILVQELEPAARMRIVRRIIERLGTIVLIALAVLIATGFVNLVYVGASPTFWVKALLVLVVFGLALYQYAFLGVRIRRLTANGGMTSEATELLARYRRVGITVGTLVLLIVYLSLGLTRASESTLG